MTTSASSMTLATNNFWVKTSSSETTLVDFYFNYYKYFDFLEPIGRQVWEKTSTIVIQN